MYEGYVHRNHQRKGSGRLVVSCIRHSVSRARDFLPRSRVCVMPRWTIRLPVALQAALAPHSFLIYLLSLFTSQGRGKKSLRHPSRGSGG